MAPLTVRNVERGADGVTMGSYLAVMQALDLETDLTLMAASDDVGRQLQDATLISRRQTPRRKSKPKPSTTAPFAPEQKISTYPMAEPKLAHSVKESGTFELIDHYRAQMDALFNAKDDTQ